MFARVFKDKGAKLPDKFAKAFLFRLVLSQIPALWIGDLNDYWEILSPFMV